MALYSNTIGSNNTGIGVSALQSNVNGGQNTAFGFTSMYSNVSGRWNNAVGSKSLYSNTTGVGNAAQGFAALYSNTTGSNNLAIGNTAGYNNKTGSANVFLGWNAGFAETGSDTLYITNNPQTPLIYGRFSYEPAENKLGIGTKNIASGDTIAVWNGARLTKGGVWTNASSRELKDDIETLSTEDANAALEALSPVRYVYKNSREEEYVGFIAEDVPELVASNDHKSLSPMDIVAVLTTVTKNLKAEIAALTTAISEQQASKDAEIASLRASLSRQEERLAQMELALLALHSGKTPADQFSLATAMPAAAGASDRIAQ
ncbi:MAG: tail fiber domain-containing protein [Haliea sp.]|nr:tail fiber domain-containing protein [Haliea sp.]